jgi:hypothetical protein
MGIEIRSETFAERDYTLFADRLRQSIEVLTELVERPGFGVGPSSIGAELELDLVDDAGHPAPVNRAVLAEVLDGRVTVEVDQFNIEINSRPTPLAGSPFTRLDHELGAALSVTRSAARAHGAHVVAIGILPTLREEHLGRGALTDLRRYRALSEGIRRVRGAPFAVRIEGDEALEVVAHDVTFEGANTSFQVHLRVDPGDFARAYNAAQIATGFALAVAGNSPYFLGRRLWHETRVALFRQCVDDRLGAEDDDWRPARVSFGHGWVRRSIVELFAESVALHEPLLPQLADEDPLAILRGGGVPSLGELRLHHGTVWRWNRAVFDDADGGHVRIELRALPSGPTAADMLANAALLVGLTRALAENAEELVTRITFGQARRNFYQAAQFGMDAEILWPAPHGRSPRATTVRGLAEHVLPLARRGLVSGGVDAEEADEWLGIVRARLEARQTGATWQTSFVGSREGKDGRSAALAAMLGRYRELQESGAPVHTWRL